MKTLSALLVTLAGIAAASGCSSPTARVGPASLGPSWVDAGTPSTSVAMEREIRFYVDETGAVWDDRGRKHGTKP